MCVCNVLDLYKVVEVCLVGGLDEVYVCPRTLTYSRPSITVLLIQGMMACIECKKILSYTPNF